MKQGGSYPLFSTKFFHPISHCCAPPLKYKKCKVKPLFTQILMNPHCKTPAGAEHAAFRTHFGSCFTEPASQATFYQPVWDPEVMNMKVNSSGLGYPPSAQVRLLAPSSDIPGGSLEIQPAGMHRFPTVNFCALQTG